MEYLKSLRTISPRTLSLCNANADCHDRLGSFPVAAIPRKREEELNKNVDCTVSVTLNLLVHDIRSMDKVMECRRRTLSRWSRGLSEMIVTLWIALPMEDIVCAGEGRVIGKYSDIQPMVLLYNTGIVHCAAAQPLCSSKSLRNTRSKVAFLINSISRHNDYVWVVLDWYSI